MHHTDTSDFIFFARLLIILLLSFRELFWAYMLSDCSWDNITCDSSTSELYFSYLTVTPEYKLFANLYKLGFYITWCYTYNCT